MKSIFVLLLIKISFLAHCQTGNFIKKNSLQADASLWGMHSRVSLGLNYERLLSSKGNISYYLRIGVSKWGGYERDYGLYYFGPKFNVGVGAFLGRRAHHLDVQIGPELYISTNYNDVPQQSYPERQKAVFSVFGLAGYRYQKVGSPFIIRIYCATYGLASVAVGYAF